MGKDRLVCRSIVLVNADVKDGLLEFFLDINLAGVLNGEEIFAHPSELFCGHTAFGDVDGGTSEVGGCSSTGGGGGIAVNANEVLLHGDSANSGVNAEGLAEDGIIGGGNVTEKFGGPGTAIAAVDGQARIDNEMSADGERQQLACAAQVVELCVIADALEAFLIRHFILMKENFMGTVERSWIAKIADDTL